VEPSRAATPRTKKGTLFLVTALEDAVIELKSLHRLLGAGGRFSFGSADLMRETLGIEPGAVTPFAAINDTERRVRVVLDAAMMAHETLNYHPLVNTMTTSIARTDLIRFLEATGHPPQIVAVALSGEDLPPT
jgi:Ala-tRNA(Pro) deacylase